MQGGQWHLSEVGRAWPEALTATPGVRLCFSWFKALAINEALAYGLAHLKPSRGRGPQKLFKSQILGGGQVHPDMEDNTSVPGPFLTSIFLPWV